jgi:hypothetical protein
MHNPATIDRPIVRYCLGLLPADVRESKRRARFDGKKFRGIASIAVLFYIAAPRCAPGSAK